MNGSGSPRTRMAFASALALHLSACFLVVGTDGLSGGPARSDDAGLPDTGSAEASDDVGAADATIDVGDPGVACAAAPDLVLHFPFDEGNGTVTRDCSGGMHDGTFLNGTTWTAGIHGAALALDGIGACVTLKGTEGLLGAGPFTVTAWVNVGSFDDDASAARYLFAKANGAPDKSGWRLASDSKGTFDLKVGEPGGAVSISSTPGAATNTWIFVASVFEPGARMEVWVDGVLGGTSSMPPASFADDPTASLWIGCHKNGNFFDGKVDELRVYQRALTGPEIAALRR